MGPVAQYRAIARELSAWALARAAGRKLSRAVRNRIDRDLFENRARGAPRVGKPSGAVANRPTVLADRASVAAALTHLPEARGRALVAAHAAMRRRFCVFGTQVWFAPGQPIDWSLDPIRGERYPPVPSGELSLHEPGWDPKYPWALGRLSHLVALGQGHWAAQSPAEGEGFARAFVEQTSSFLAANPPGVGIQWTSPMEVALRAANLALAWTMFEDAPVAHQGGFRGRVLAALAAHAAFVERHLEDGALVPNNHLVADHVGLLVVSALFPELAGSARRLGRSARVLAAQLAAQVHPDGYAFEGSVPYHRLSVELFTLGWLAARAGGAALGEGYLERLQRMYRVCAAYCSEDGQAPQVGDNDSGRALPLRARAGLDHGYLAALGAALFDEPGLKLWGSAFPDEALWLTGELGRARFERLASSAPPWGFSSRPGGLHVLRVRLGGGASGHAVLTVSAGPKGQRGVGGHSHHDQLSFELHVAGRPLIVDPGTGQYTRDPARRNHLRADDAHNALVVDERLRPLPRGRLFALPDPSPAEVVLFAAGERLGRLEAASRAFAPIVHSRSFLLDGEVGALAVWDALEGAGTHRWTSWLQLPDEQARLRPASVAERARARRIPFVPERLGELAVELGPREAPFAVILVEAGALPRIERAEYSPGYGELCAAAVVRCTREARLPARSGWIVLFGDQGHRPGWPGKGGV